MTKRHNNLDAVDIDGAVRIHAAVTILVADASEEKLTITGTNGQTALDVSADGN